MLDDGEKLVPGLPPGARAARVDRRAPAVRGRQGRRHRHPRRDPRARAARPSRARRRRRLRDDHRRQGHDLPADGRGDRRRGLRHARRSRRRARPRPQPLPGSETGEQLPARRAARAQGGAAARRAGDLRVRAGAARQARAGAQATAARPTSTTSAAGCGSGWGPARAASASTARPGSCTPPAGSAPSRPTPRCSTSSRSAGRACGRSSTATSCARSRFDEWIFHGVLDVDHLPADAGARPIRARREPALRRRRDRRRHRRAGRRRRGWPRPGADVCVVAKGVGSTHLAPGTIDVLGYAPERVESPAAAIARARRARTPTTPTRCSAPTLVAEAADWFIATAAAGRAARLRLRRQPRAQPAAADRRRRAEALGARARRPSRPATRGSSGAWRVVGIAAAARLPREPVRREPARRRHRRDRGRRRRSSSTAPTRARSGSRAASTIRELARRLQRAAGAADQRRPITSALPAMLGLRRPARGAGRPRGAARPPRVRDPDAAAVGSRACASTRSCASALRAAGGRLVLGAGVVAHQRDGERVCRGRRPPPPARTPATRRARSCSRRAASTPGRSTLDSHWQAHEQLLDLPLTGCPSWRAAVRRLLLRRAAAGACGVAVDSELRAAERHERRRRRRLAARRRRLARGLGRGDRAGQRLPRRAGHRPTRLGAGGSGMTDLIELDAAARLARPLRQVHDLRDRLPGLERDARCSPGRSTPGPQSERYRVSGEPTRRRVGRLLLGLRDLLAGLPAGGQDRRDQRPGAQRLKTAEGHPAARPHHHAADLARPRRHAGRAARQLDAALAAAADPGREAARRAPRRARAALCRAPLLALGAAAQEPARRQASRIVYFHGCGTEYYEPWEGERVVAVLEHNGFEVVVPKQDCCGLPLQSSGLFDEARSVRQAAGPPARLAAHRRHHDHRRQRHQLHADAQARGARDPQPRGRPRPAARGRAHLRHLRAAARAAPARRAAHRLPAAARAHRLPRPVPAAGPLDRQAGARAAGADPRARRARDERALLRDRRHLRAQGREV